MQKNYIKNHIQFSSGFQKIDEKDFEVVERKGIGHPDTLADVAIYLLKLADKTKIDLKTAIENKLVKASKKYPIEKVKGDSKEYYRLKKQARNKQQRKQN